MSFQSKFCIIGAPIVALGFALQAFEDPAPVKMNDRPAITYSVPPVETPVKERFGTPRQRETADLRPGELTLADCYDLRGDAPEWPCDGLKGDGESTPAQQEQRAVQELIEDGTAEHAQEFAGK